MATILVLLNMATNISLIADAKIAELQLEPNPSLAKKWLSAFVGVAAVLVGTVFAGSYLSKEKYLGIVRDQAQEVVEQNRDVLEEASSLLSSGKPQDYKRAFEIRSFLENQRSGLPQLTLIYSGKFADKPALYKVTDYFSGDAAKGIYNPAYFACTKNLDCDYLTRFFSGNNVDILQKYTVRDEEFYIYMPFIGRQARFVLLFERRNSYGKIGS